MLSSTVQRGVNLWSVLLSYLQEVSRRPITGESKIAVFLFCGLGKESKVSYKLHQQEILLEFPMATVMRQYVLCKTYINGWAWEILWEWLCRNTEIFSKKKSLILWVANIWPQRKPRNLTENLSSYKQLLLIEITIVNSQMVINLTEIFPMAWARVICWIVHSQKWQQKVLWKP